MGMTIDDAIRQLSMHKFYVLGNDYEAVQEAIATMRKYQKIEQIIIDNDNDGRIGRQVRELVNDSN